MTDGVQVELDIDLSPGALLKAERLVQGMSEREAADRLNWMPNYVAVMESDNYDKLRNRAFARGYMKAYVRLLGLDEDILIAAFDRLEAADNADTQERRIETKPLHLHKTGVAVACGVGILALLVFFMWWRSA